MRAAIVLGLLAAAFASGLRGEPEHALTAPVSLSAGIPRFDTVPAGQYNQYTIVLQYSGSPSITVDVIPYAGDPDVFVTVDGSTPNASNYNYASNGLGNEHIEITATGPRYCAASPCTVNIGVMGFLANSSYTIIVFQAASIVTLTNGSPLLDAAYPGAYRYYSFYAGAEGAPVSFTLTSYTQNVAAVNLAAYVIASPSQNGVYPSATNFTWSSGGSDGRRYPFINIPSTDPNYCIGCFYYVSVLGPPRSAVEVPFSIVPVNGAPYIRLLSNVIQNAYVDVSQYTYFTYRAVGNAQYVLLGVVAQQGDPDLFVTADGTQPSQYNYQWMSNRVGSDLVNITSKSPTWVNRCSFSGCQLNIAVYGYQAASFTAIATAQ